jgi:RNAse (barnase) inhibitor barstar
MASEKEKTITLDAINWKTRNDFYRDFCIHTSPPKCWGNTLNLDALW